MSVHPGIGGMSVSPSLRDLPYFRVPKRLRALHPRASGSADLYIWSMGTGGFVAGSVTAQLQLRLDPGRAKHGLVEPTVRMSLNDCQSALTTTLVFWTLDEK